MRIAIFGNEYQHEHLADLQMFLATLKRKDIEIEMEQSFYRYIVEEAGTRPDVEALISSSADIKASMAVSLGGDGTFLRTARKVALLDIPILGINTGHLGYLADVPVSEMESVIDDILNDNFIIEPRTMLEVEWDGIDIPFPYALNEITILKQDTASMIEMRTEINDVHLTNYLADGLIIATPTGSTAYNLSVGGPIIEHSSRSFAISPVAAHSLTLRPLVVNDDSRIKVTTTSRASTYRLSLDGRSFTLPGGMSVRIKKAPYVVKVMQRPGHNFALTLRNKLMWGINNK